MTSGLFQEHGLGQQDPPQQASKRKRSDGDPADNNSDNGLNIRLHREVYEYLRKVAQQVIQCEAKIKSMKDALKNIWRMELYP